MYMCLYIHTLVSQFRFGGMVGVKCEAWASLLSPCHGPKYNTKTCIMFPENSHERPQWGSMASLVQSPLLRHKLTTWRNVYCEHIWLLWYICK